LHLHFTKSNMSEGPLYRDPWARREAWRKSPIFSTRTQMRKLFPGFGIAVVAFGVYLIAEQTMYKPKASDSLEQPHH